MPGTFSGKALANGQLAAAKATLYSPGAGVTAYVKSVKFSNRSGATTETLELWKNATGTSRRIYRAVLLPNESAIYDEPEILETGDLLEGNTTNAATVDFDVSGVEEV